MDQFFRDIKDNKAGLPNRLSKRMGELIRKARREKGYKQAQLGTLLNRRTATISDIENGKTEISVQTLLLFSSALETPIINLIPREFHGPMAQHPDDPIHEKILELIDEIQQANGDLDFSIELLRLQKKYARK